MVIVHLTLMAIITNHSLHEYTLKLNRSCQIQYKHINHQTRAQENSILILDKIAKINGVKF